MAKTPEARKNYLLQYYKDEDKWKVRKEGASRASRVFDNKKAAIRWGKERANEVGTSLEIFTRDGRHMETDSYATTDKESTNKY